MNDTKFQIDITEGELEIDQKIPADVAEPLCRTFGVPIGKLRDYLCRKDSTSILLCEQDDVEQILKLLNSIGISAEAQLANISQEDQEDQEDSLFGSIDMNDLGLDNEEKVDDSDCGLLFDISDDALFETIPDKTLAADEKKTNLQKNEFLFDENEDVELVTEVTAINSKSKLSEDIKEEKISAPKVTPQQLNVDFENEENESSDNKINLPKTQVHETPKTEPESAIHQSSSTVKTNDQSQEIYQANLKNYAPVDPKANRSKKIIVVFIVILIGFFFSFLGSDNSHKNIEVTSAARIKKIVSKNESRAVEVLTEVKPIEVLKTEIYEGTIDFSGNIGKLTTKISGKDLISIELEIENTIPPTNSEAEYISRAYLPKFIALRVSGDSNGSQSNKLSTSARINYKLGNEKKKLVSPILSVLDATSETLILTTSEQSELISSDNLNKISLESNPSGGNISLNAYIKVSLKKVDVSNLPTRSISELIDNQVKSKENQGDKKEKQKSKKKKLDE